MSITRLQQARQMYALGQRVGFRGGGRDASEADFDTPSADNTGNTGGGQVDTGDLGTEKANVQANIDANMDSRDRARMNQYRNLPTPTVTIGVDKFNNPIKVKTTYTDRRNRQLALDALNKKGISSFDPRVTKKNINFLDPNNLMTSFAPQQKKFGLLDLALIAATGGLFGTKIATGAKMFNTAKNISKFAETIGLTDKNVVNAFTSNFMDKVSNLGSGKKSTKSTTTKDEDIFTGGGDGIEGLGNNDALNQEYLLLLNKFNTGVFTDADQVRFTFLQKILGK
jgi:hypothetical protein